MDKFETQFSDLDVQTSYMEQTMSSSTATTTPQDQVDALINRVADEAGLERQHELGTRAKVPDVAVQQEEAEKPVGEEDARLAERLRALRVSIRRRGGGKTELTRLFSLRLDNAGGIIRGDLHGNVVLTNLYNQIISFIYVFICLSLSLYLPTLLRPSLLPLPRDLLLLHRQRLRKLAPFPDLGPIKESNERHDSQQRR